MLLGDKLIKHNMLVFFSLWNVIIMMFLFCLSECYCFVCITMRLDDFAYIKH